jgi:predicted Zn finger-like uncharacterized protein
MIEIVCPACEAHYELPDGSIGPEGRRVSCSNCAHKWRAYPRGMEPAEAETPPAPQPAAPPEAPPESQPEPPGPAMAGPAPEPAPEPPDRPQPDPAAERESITATLATISGASTETTEAAATPAPAEGGRNEQMAAIRKMLADLKESADAAPEPAAAEPEPEPEEPAGPAPVMRKRADEEEADEDRDPLKSRIDNLTQLNRAVRGEPTQTGYDAAKLRRLHERRAKKFQRRRERRKKSGGFLTGFTLVATVAAVMVGLYVMKPQIIAASPEMAPAMNEYVATIDNYRVGLNDATAEYRDWLMQRIDKLRGKAEEEAQ